MTVSGVDARRALASKLRTLREAQWEGAKITQRTLADALGVSEALVSSWESQRAPAIPPHERIAGYATFFATRRSMQGLLVPTEALTPDEQATRTAILDELATLREEALRSETAPQRAGALGGSWHFADGGPVRIVCTEVPEEQRNPDATPTHPTLEYGELYSFSSIDALFELHGHIRAANPHSDVQLVKQAEIRRHHLAEHLVVLGGIDLNSLTRQLQDDPALTAMQVRQVSPNENDPAEAYYEVTSAGESRRHSVSLSVRRTGQRELSSDVGLYLRAPNPFNGRRTLTVCHGIYSLGTYGVVRALTHAEFRDRNEEFLRARFGGSDRYCILTRVKVVNGTTASTPDWTDQDTRLYEWPEAGQ